VTFVSHTNTNANTQRNDDWVDVMVENNIPLASVESRSFGKFIKTHIPEWDVASRHQISDLYIPRMSEKIQTEFEDSLSKNPNQYLSVEFDHWKDANHRSLLGVIITQSDKKHFQDLVDVSIVGHRASVIVEQLKKV